MGNPELQKNRSEKSKKYLAGYEAAKDFYQKYFDKESVPREQLQKFDQEKDTVVALLKDEIGRIGDKNPKRKAHLLTQERLIEGISLTFRQSIKRLIANTKRSFLDAGGVSYELTDESSIRDFFGRRFEEGRDFRKDKSEAAEMQREFDLEVKKIGTKYFKELKEIRAKLFDRVDE